MAVSALPSPATTSDSGGQHEKGAFADSLFNHILEDITPSFLGITQAKPILSCVVKGTQLPSKRGPVGSTDLDASHPRSIMNPQPSPSISLEGFDRMTASGLFVNYLDHIIPQYPIYHRNDITTAFNSIYHPASNPGQDSARNRYIVSMIMSISLCTAARANQKRANAHAYLLVRHAMQWMPQVCTNDIPGLQAMLLLTQYTFLNPAMADVWLLTGLISQSVIDLGLHHELPNDSRVSVYERDMRRRLFWVAWEMEVAVCSIFTRPVSLPIRRYDVAFPAEVDDTAITEAAIDHFARASKFTSKRIWLFRQIEAEIMSVMHQSDPLPTDCVSLDDWMPKMVSSIAGWHKEVYQASSENTEICFQSRWEEMKLWSDIGHPYLLLILYKPSKRVPHPKSESWMTALFSAVQIADGYCKQAESGDGNIKYVFQPCHQCFAAALVFLQALSCCKLEIPASHTWEEIQVWMSVFSKFFSIISERWPAATRCLEEYERLLEPIKREYLDLSRSKHKHVPQQTTTLGTELGEIYNSWAVSNASSTTDSPEVLSGYAYCTPQDWKREFNLDLNVVMETIPGG
jgi:hypothetical protein